MTKRQKEPIVLEVRSRSGPIARYIPGTEEGTFRLGSYENTIACLEGARSELRISAENYVIQKRRIDAAHLRYIRRTSQNPAPLKYRIELPQLPPSHTRKLDHIGPQLSNPVWYGNALAQFRLLQDDAEESA